MAQDPPGTTIARRFLQTMTSPLAPAIDDPRDRRMVYAEMTVVLGITFALSGYTSILSLVQSLLAAAPLNEQTQTLNASVSSVALLDIGWQLSSIVRLCLWAALPVLVLWHSRIGPNVTVGEALGLRLRGGQWKAALGWGVALTAVIGIPGLALYVGSVAAGINSQVEASGLVDAWWRVPVLLASAGANAAAEELVVVAYLVVRLRQLGVSVWWTIAASALLRASYHLYQGFGGGVGNLLMGALCVVFFLAVRKVWPLIVAHFLLDAFAFIGYAVLAPQVSWL